MKVVFAGKGGSGKSAIAGTFVRALAQEGQPVLAIDSDPMPGLAWSIGMSQTDDGFPDEAVEAGEEGGPRYVLREGLSPEEAVERYAQRGPDGVRFIQYGKLRGHVGTLARSQHAFSAITHGIDDSRWHLVGDLPAGTRQAFFGWASFADTMVVVVEPTAKSILSARRLARMANPHGRAEKAHVPRVVAVVNKHRPDIDSTDIAARTGLDVVATVPFDPGFAAAERQAHAPFDAVHDGPAVSAIVSFARRMQDQGSRPTQEQP